MSGMLRLVAVVLMVMLTGCGPAPAASKPSLTVANGTTLTVTLVVNGVRIADYSPGAPDPSIDPAVVPALPWTVEVRSPSGRILTSMHVEIGEVTNAGNVHQIPTGMVDLSCGRLVVFAGDYAPSIPPPGPSPGTASDCVP